MNNDIIKIRCPKCLELSEFELPIDTIIVKRDDFTDDLLNQGYTKGLLDGKEISYQQIKDIAMLLKKSYEPFTKCADKQVRARFLGKIDAIDELLKKMEE